MKRQKSKKSVLFIVEGSSDKAALEKIFKTIYKEKNIVFKFTHGDITSNDKITEKNICDEILKIVKNYMNQNKLKKSDIWQIVQIFDMDGSYIPESAILYGNTDYFQYSLTAIACKDPKKVLIRNQKKKALMEYLNNIKDIEGISYITYYMSSNLDHALYDIQTLDSDLKQAYADEFYEFFDGREEFFIDFLKSDVVNGVPSSYPGSWKYIKEQLHSLERHTNLHIYFKDNPYQ